MEDNKELVTDVTENVVEQATEELVDSQSKEEMFTKAQVDEMIAKKLARKEAKLRKEYDNKYSRAENVLKAGLEVDSFDMAIDKLETFYQDKGISIPKQDYSQREIEILAKADAEEIIEGGYEELVEEVDRLASIGLENMTSKEKLVFSKLAQERTKQEALKDLASIGVTEKALEDEEFIAFSEKLNPNMSMKDKYEMYTKYRPKPKVEPIGSMKGTLTKETGVKEFYTREEALQFTREDYDKNPELFKAVEKSMTRW